tara:strand:- start:182 stop:454 length:273 start_codon:yes stop_codon:yes gene_type:complete
MKDYIKNKIVIPFDREIMIHPRYATYINMPLSMITEYQETLLKACHLATMWPTADFRIFMEVAEGKRTIDYLDDEENYCVVISELLGEEE